MKYIRTKDTRNVKRYAKVKLEEWEGIVLIDLDKEKFEVARYDDYTKPEWLMNGENYGDIPFSRIIKTADTIEELCDEAVFFDKDNKPHYKSQESNIWYLGASLFTETLRFGVFTDKGLIYVAKMNGKGELELL